MCDREIKRKRERKKDIYIYLSFIFQLCNLSVSVSVSLTGFFCFLNYLFIRLYISHHLLLTISQLFNAPPFYPTRHSTRKKTPIMFLVCLLFLVVFCFLVFFLFFLFFCCLPCISEPFDLTATAVWALEANIHLRYAFVNRLISRKYNPLR